MVGCVVGDSRLFGGVYIQMVFICIGLIAINELC